jgi:hypothetical protein
MTQRQHLRIQPRGGGTGARGPMDAICIGVHRALHDDLRAHGADALHDGAETLPGHPAECAVLTGTLVRLLAGKAISATSVAPPSTITDIRAVPAVGDVFATRM